MPRVERKALDREATDESLMSRYADGDVDGFDVLFTRYEGRLHAYFLRRTGSAERARDLYQELFLRVHHARDAYDPARPFAPWLFQIAHRLLVDDQRRAYRSHEVPIEDRDRFASPPRSEELLTTREQLGQALGALSDDERYVLVASKLEGVGYSDLARRLGKSVDAVKKMASRATQRLRAESVAAGQRALQSR